MQKSLFSSDGNIIEKIDQTPVTVADFGVQALISLGIVVDARRYCIWSLVNHSLSTFFFFNVLFLH